MLERLVIWRIKSVVDKLVSLTPLAEEIVCQRKTEYPHSGSYNHLATKGTYLCRRCGYALFRASSQFHSGTGWPSFDEIIGNAVKEQEDSDGLRVEIICNRCCAHLGHVFRDEFLTEKNCRYCVNSAALDWVENTGILDTEEAIVAGGCFWGVEYYLCQLKGVLKVESGYSGGMTDNPHYQDVCTGITGHLEVVRIVFDPQQTTYHAVIQRFFEIHDPTQQGGQGPDLGEQYQSAIFCYDQQQKDTALALIQQLKDKGYPVVTQIREVETFWPAEEYHQGYYEKHQKQPYCHHLVPRFR